MQARTAKARFIRSHPKKFFSVRWCLNAEDASSAHANSKLIFVEFFALQHRPRLCAAKIAAIAEPRLDFKARFQGSKPGLKSKAQIRGPNPGGRIEGSNSRLEQQGRYSGRRAIGSFCCGNAIGRA